MKPAFLPLILLFYACGTTASTPATQEPKIVEKQDTCFYEINCAPDLDLPQTPAWDTTITRTNDCDIQMLKMRSWGTETEYRMSGPGSARGGCHFTGGNGLIDITGMPAGEYYFSLTSCGNGGGFTVHIK